MHEGRMPSPRAVNAAILKTYLHILSKYPDTFIAKKEGMKKAIDISGKAKEALSGKIPISVFDKELRTPKNPLNPGTTADIVSAVVFVCLLKNRVF